jgi:hypothetical protein
MASAADVASARLAAAYALQITPGPDKPIKLGEKLRGSPNIGGGEADPRKMDATDVALTGVRYATTQIYSILMGKSGIVDAQNRLITERSRQDSDKERNRVNPDSVRQIGGNTTATNDYTAALISTWLIRNVFKVGNCQELAYAAYVFLRGVNPAPTAKLHVATLGVEHALVILGEIPGGTCVYALDGQDIIICDPWLGRKAQFYNFMPDKNYHVGVFTDVAGSGLPRLMDYECVLTAEGCGGNRSYAEQVVGIAL